MFRVESIIQASRSCRRGGYQAGRHVEQLNTSKHLLVVVPDSLDRDRVVVKPSDRLVPGMSTIRECRAVLRRMDLTG
jgi:hypothetical protein